MAAVNTARRSLDNYIVMLYQDGVLEHSFQNLRDMEKGCPGTLQFITKHFCDSTESDIFEMIRLLDRVRPDYKRAEIYCQRLKSRSASMHTKSMTDACVELQKTMNFRDAAGSIRDLRILRDSYLDAKRSFIIILEQEHRILTIEDALEPQLELTLAPPRPSVVDSLPVGPDISNLRLSIDHDFPPPHPGPYIDHHLLSRGRRIESDPGLNIEQRFLTFGGPSEADHGPSIDRSPPGNPNVSHPGPTREMIFFL